MRHTDMACPEHAPPPGEGPVCGVDSTERTAVTPEVAPEPVGADAQDKELATPRADLEKREQTAREAQDRYLRTLADFENYKKRNQKEQSEQVRFSGERLIRELLPVVDNLERALSHASTTQDFTKMLEGIVLVHKQQMAVLEKFGVRPIESLNAPFDPLVHQSIGQVEIPGTDGDEVEGRVVSESQRGYFLYERVLRPALVVIGAKTKPTTPTDVSPAGGATPCAPTTGTVSS